MKDESKAPHPPFRAGSEPQREGNSEAPHPPFRAGSEPQRRGGSLVTNQFVTASKVAFSKQMRQEMTHCESIVWDRIRRNRLGVNFRRQQIIEGFIADFYCHTEKLVIEVDDPGHDPVYDKARDDVFAKRGIRVLRFKNEQVTRRVGYVLAVIQDHLRKSNEQADKPET